MSDIRPLSLSSVFLRRRTVIAVAAAIAAVASAGTASAGPLHLAASGGRGSGGGSGGGGGWGPPPTNVTVSLTDNGRTLELNPGSIVTVPNLSTPILNVSPFTSSNAAVLRPLIPVDPPPTIVPPFRLAQHFAATRDGTATLTGTALVVCRSVPCPLALADLLVRIHFVVVPRIQLPATSVTIGPADNGRTLQLGLGSSISIVPVLPAATSSNSKVVSVSTICAAAGPGMPIGGCWTNGYADGIGSTTVGTATWHVTITVWPNPRWLP